MKKSNWLLILILCPLALHAAAPAPAMPGGNVSAIKVNTVGYPPSWRKIAMLNFKPNKPALVDETGKRIYEIPAENIKNRGVDAASQDEVWQLDFSSFKMAGKFRLQNGRDRSESMAIGDHVYTKALEAALKMFYYQRCGVRLMEPATLWNENDDVHGYEREHFCHKDQIHVYRLDDYPAKHEELENLNGGWHDAGNYDMYVPSTAVSAYLLLLAHDSGVQNGNDILEEARVGIEWICRMSLADGSTRARLGIYRQGESKSGSADDDEADRWVSGPTTASTAKACALFARAYLCYRGLSSYTEGMEDTSGNCKTTATKAWTYLLKHSGRLVADNHGSDQPLWDDSPEYSEVSQRALAAAEMWVSFKDKSALDYLTKVWNDPELMPAKFEKGAWGNLGRFVMIRVAHGESFSAEMRAEAKKRILDCVAPYRDQVETKDGYRCATLPSDYYWGSNSNLLEKAQLMLEAAKLDPVNFAWAVDAARDQWHWILGRNPNGFSMVTRVGKGPDRLYHLEWGKKKVPPPGYLIDGPNFSNAAFLSPSAPAKALLWDNQTPLKGSGLPAHALWHNEQEDLWEGGFVSKNKWDTGWWVVMEPDIYYNANLVAVAAEMQD